MMKTKKDIDKHVSDILSKIKNESERNLRGFNFAKLYYSAKEYDVAKRFLSGFLSCKETPPAQKLMGQVYEQLGQLEKAVQSYKRSLELDGHQKDVVLKLCELYCQIPVDPERARYWADRAEQLFPHSEIVFRLRECLVNGDGDQNTQELEDLITNELVVRPRDAKLRIKLLKLYLDNERIKEAYDHAIQVEKKRPHPDNIEWYYCLVDVFEVYLEDQNQRYDQALCIQILSALDRLVYLNILENFEADKENCGSSYQPKSLAASSNLNKFDHHLHQATKVQQFKSDYWNAFIDHMKGQLYLYMAMLIFKKMKLEHGNQREASKFGAALLLSAYSFKAPNLTKGYVQLNEDEKEIRQFLYCQACYRLSQAGHVIIGLCREDKSKWLGKIREQVCTPQVKEKIFQRVFNNKSNKQDSSLSYFMQSNLLGDMSEEFPDVKSLSEYDSTAITLYPANLHQLVWISLQQYNPKNLSQPMYGCQVFKGLQFNHAKMENPAPESLCALDIEAFLYATVRCTAMSNNDGPFSFTNSEQSWHLPAILCKQLCTDDQSEFWSAAFKLHSNTCLPDKVGEARRRLQHVIEVIRCIGVHGMDVNLVVYLARLFSEKVAELKTEIESNSVSRSCELKDLEARAELYWKAAIDLLEKIVKNVAIRCPKERLFPSFGQLPSFEESNNLLEDGRFFLARQAMNNGNLEDAIEKFESLSTAYASFYQALSYKKLAADEFGSKPRESITSEMRSRHVILLTRARAGLYRTLDRIGSDQKHPLIQMLPEEMDYIETRLARIDPDLAQRQDCIPSEESYTQDSDEQDSELPGQSFQLNMFADLKNFTESPRPTLNVVPSGLLHPKKYGASPRHQAEHVRPSPERLDAQIKSLANWHETVIQTLVEQNKNLMETNRAIVDQLKENKTVVEQLTVQLVELNKKIPTMAKRTLRNKPRNSKSAAPHPNAHRQPQFEDEGEEEDYYDGYYYHEDDSEAESNAEKLDLHDNPAYVYPEQPSNSDYRFGQNTGFGGPSNFGYPSPQAGYSYFPAAPGQQPLGSNGAPSLIQGHPSQSFSGMNSQYYGSGQPAMFTGLQFNEGQKLPEFHFNIDSQLSLNDSNSLIYGGKIVDVHSAQQFISSTTGATSSNSPFLSAAVTAPHAFQIPLPQNAFFQDTESAQNGFTQAVTDSNLGKESKVAENLSQSKDLNISRTESESYNEDDSHGPDFKPIIPLPAEVEVTTGEEDEKVLFEDRAKLYRYVSKEWKERGLGIVKILHNEKTNKLRLLMRRDQIFKICANHYIMSDMVLMAMKNSDQMFIWAAQDFSDGQVNNEQFCIKFKTVEIGRQFKEKFELAKNLSKQKTVTDKENVIVKTTEVNGFGDQFKPKPGTWNCSECYVNNSPDTNKCIVCGNINLSITVTSNSTTSASTAIPPVFKFGLSTTALQTTTSVSPITTTNSNTVTEGFKFGGSRTVSKSLFTEDAKPDEQQSMGFGDKFKPKPGSWECTTCYVSNSQDATHCAACTTPDPSNTSKQVANTLPPAVSSFKFGFPISSTQSTASPQFAFGTSNPEAVTNDESSPGFVFGKSPQSKPSGFVFGATNIKSDVEEADEEQQQQPDSTTPNKIVLGGFSFKSPPIVAVTKESDDKPIKLIGSKKFGGSAKPNPFSNFSFSSLEKPNNDPTVKDSFFSNSSTSDEKILGSVSSHSSLSFEALAKTEGSKNAFKQDPNFKGFQEPGSSVIFSPSSPQDKANASEEYEPNVQFKPVIPLPELVNTCTGEEEEEKLFGERAKLFRFETQAKVWKERGLGELKILKHKQTSRVRILMRRDQVLKICANHNITESMVLQPMQSSENAWIWVANDFSEGELREEKFAAKFRNAEIGKLFCEVFEKAKKSAGETIPPVAISKTEEESKLQKPLSELFKPDPDSWKCEICEVRNARNHYKCAACNSSKPVEAGEKVCPGLNLSEMFKPEEGSWKCSTCLIQNKSGEIKCVACNTFKPGHNNASEQTNAIDLSTTAPAPSFKFGFSQSTPKKDDAMPKAADSTTTTTGFQFSLGAPSAFQFGATSPSKPEFQFGSSQPFNFSFDGVRPKSPIKTPKSPVYESATEGEAEDDTTLDSEGDSIYFHPVIPLPEKVDLRTGEEDEDVLYSQQSKLFRWVDGEWKERGFGDFKILLHKMTKKIRLFMRRKPILKVCCNHYLTKELEFSAKDDRSWLWSAQDFADHDLRQETLVLRFKTAELSLAFKDAIDDAKRRMDVGKSPILSTPAGAFKSFSFKATEAVQRNMTDNQKQENIKITTDNEVTKNKSSVEIEVVDEKLPVNSLRNKAESLMLPTNFYNYLEKPNCSGCRGCYSSDEEEKNEDSDVAIVYIKSPTAEQIKKAKDLLLPPTFYLYEDLPPCPGCRGCNDFIPNIEPKPEIVEVVKHDDPPKEFHFGETKLGTGLFSFAEVSRQGKSDFKSFATDSNYKFAGAGAQLFVSSPSNNDDSENGVENNDCDPQFQPVIPLPELVATVTGEEEENKLFGERCKLYLYDSATKQWKERGTGEMKILKHKTTSKSRLLMRREQIFLTVCNQAITPDVVFKKLPTSETAWTWIGNDFSGGKAEYLSLSVRFKTIAIAEQFHEVIKMCQNTANDSYQTY